MPLEAKPKSKAKAKATAHLVRDAFMHQIWWSSSQGASASCSTCPIGLSPSVLMVSAKTIREELDTLKEVMGEAKAQQQR